jgi:phosphoribosylformimino-5-aminoimidazole carboxamide ribonucleotide (ProFAR) isomerase
VQKEAREAQRHKITHNVSYAEAAMQIGGTIRQNDVDNRVTPGISGPTVGNIAYVDPDMDTRPVQKSCSHKCVVSKDTLIVLSD